MGMGLIAGKHGDENMAEEVELNEQLVVFDDDTCTLAKALGAATPSVATRLTTGMIFLNMKLLSFNNKTFYKYFWVKLM